MAGHKVRTKLFLLFENILAITLEALTRFVHLGQKDLPAIFSPSFCLNLQLLFSTVLSILCLLAKKYQKCPI